MSELQTWMRLVEGDLTPTPDDLAWFSGSRIVDDSGKPLVLYHGTTSRFDRFMPSESGAYGPGIYLTPYPDQARRWGYRKGAEPQIIALLARITKPYYWTSDDCAVHADLVSKRARASGHDGVICQWMDGSMEIVAFRGDQLRRLDVSDVALGEADELPVYHGTDRDFTTFDDAARGTSTNHPTALLGHFVSRSKGHAATYPAFSQSKHVLALMLRRGRYYKMPINQYYDRFPRRTSPDRVLAFRAELESAGYDGIAIVKPDAEFPTALLGEVGTLIVFNPKHLRLK